MFIDLFIPNVSCLKEISHASGEAWNRNSKWCSDLPASNISVHIHCSPGPHTEGISIH